MTIDRMGKMTAVPHLVIGGPADGHTIAAVASNFLVPVRGERGLGQFHYKLETLFSTTARKLMAWVPADWTTEDAIRHVFDRYPRAGGNEEAVLWHEIM
jgi:hypothetical protein